MNSADFLVQNFSALISVSKHRICSSSESMKLFRREMAVFTGELTDDGKESIPSLTLMAVVSTFVNLYTAKQRMKSVDS